MSRFTMLVGLALLTCTACEVSKAPPAADTAPEEAADPAGTVPPGTPSGAAVPSGEAASGVEAAAAANVQKAEAGVGKRGRDYGGGILTQPLQTRFRAEERLNFLQVDHALNLYKAEHGKLPASHEEFMEKIIESNKIQLPPLPAGDEYVFDPEKGELMVKHAE